MPEARVVPITAIAIRPDRLRALRPEVVAALAESMKQQGQLQPIVLREREEAGYWLVAGRHRVAAAEKLKMEFIRAAVFASSMDSDQAELAEIDENLIRAELSPAERAAHIAARKAVYERIHPESAHGATGRGRRKSRKVCDSNDRFTKATADATGQSERTVQLDAQRGGTLGRVDLSRVVGTSLDKGDELDALAKMSQESRDALIERAEAGEKVSAKTAIKKEQRDTKQKVLAGIQLASPAPIYGCVLEDYEWDFKVYSRDTGMDRHAGNHYPTSEDAHTAAEIVERTKPRMQCAAPDCVIGAWCTVPHLSIALEVMRLRGFDYKSSFVWVKDHTGTGYWNRNKHEIFLVGTRGNVPAPAMGTQFESVVDAPRGAHSVKPDWQYEFFERHFPDMPKIELNARRRRDGWAAWGLDAPTDAAGIVLAHDADGVVAEPTTTNRENALTPAPAAPLPEFDDIPECLRRNPDNSFVSPVVSPRVAQSADAGETG